MAVISWQSSRAEAFFARGTVSLQQGRANEDDSCFSVGLDLDPFVCIDRGIDIALSEVRYVHVDRGVGEGSDEPGYADCRSCAAELYYSSPMCLYLTNASCFYSHQATHRLRWWSKLWKRVAMRLVPRLARRARSSLITCKPFLTWSAKACHLH